MSRVTKWNLLSRFFGTNDSNVTTPITSIDPDTDSVIVLRDSTLTGIRETKIVPISTFKELIGLGNPKQVVKLKAIGAGVDVDPDTSVYCQPAGADIRVHNETGFFAVMDANDVVRFDTLSTCLISVYCQGDDDVTVFPVQVTQVDSSTYGYDCFLFKSEAFNLGHTQGFNLTLEFY